MIPKLVIFDLDGTLAESKQPLTSEMALRLSRLLAVTRVAVVSGGGLPQFLSQIVARLPEHTNLAHLYLLPTSGAALYEYKDGEWAKVYEERLSEKDAAAIEAAMREAAKETGIIDFREHSYGKRIEYRGSQVTLSALGQQAPIVLKRSWDPYHAKRQALRAAIALRLPDFLVTVGGSTSIDVTREGIDKAYGVHQLCERLHLSEKEALYVGDELGKGGNDEAVYKTAVETKSVGSPFDTACLIDSMLATA